MNTGDRVCAPRLVRRPLRVSTWWTDSLRSWDFELVTFAMSSTLTFISIMRVACAIFPMRCISFSGTRIRYALWPDQWTRPVYCQNDYRDIRKLNILELESDFDLFNDGTLKLLKTPGHSPGHQVLIVDLPNRGRICLAADTGHQRDGFENMVPMPWDWSTSAMTITRMRMKQLERTGIPLFFCHDASDFAKLPQNGQFWE